MHFSRIWVGCFLCFCLVLAWLLVAELHSTMSIFLLAGSLNFQLYWRAGPSFAVLANTGILFRKALACPGAEGVFHLSTRRDSGREESEEGGNGVTIEEGPPGLLSSILFKK